MLDKCRYPTQSPDITLMDLNPALTNGDDDFDGLKTQLDQRFDSAQVEVVGAVGIFSART